MAGVKIYRAKDEYEEACQGDKLMPKMPQGNQPSTNFNGTHKA